jgi:HEAT repeat protein
MQEEVPELLRQSEGLKLDFKRELYKVDKSKYPSREGREREWDEFVKDILALTNGNVGVADQPAYLIIGADDHLKPDKTRDLFDVGEVKLTQQQILTRVNARCSPPIPDLICETIQLEGHALFVVQIPPSPHLHEITKRLQTPKTNYNPGTIFVRRGEDIFPATESERQAIREDKTRVFRHSDYVKEKFSQEQIQIHRESLTRISRYSRWVDETPDESFIDSQAIQLPLFASPYEDIEGSVEELQEYIRYSQRLLILGEPGMGKTVTLERAMYEFSTSTTTTIPVLVPLIQYDVDLMHTLMMALNETGVLKVANGGEVEQLVHSYDCVFLFDGLNEVAGVQRDKLYAELASFFRTHSSTSFIITSRSQDDLWRRFHSRGLIEDAVVVRRITEEQSLDYLQAHLGKRRGQELYDRLNEALRGLARIPLLLWLIKEAGLAGEELPGNRGELFDRFVKRVLKREQKQPDIVTVPAHQKVQALSYLAVHLQQERRLACSYEEASQVIQQSAKSIDGESIVKESLRNGLLIGEAQLHFMHQAVLEYFAAFRLAKLTSSLLPSKGRLASSIRGLFSSVDFKRQLRKWAKDDWWAEVIVQLSGLTHHPDLLAKQVLHSNPWLAYWCSIEGKSLDAETQDQVESQTVARLSSPKFEERLRVVNELARMENPRTIKHLIRALDDPTDAVQDLASQTLVKLGEPAVDPLLELLEIASDRARRAATRTLGTIWRFPTMVMLGSEQGQDRQTAANSLGNLGDDRAVLPLSSYLEDIYLVRVSAAEALGKLGNAQAVGALMAALERSYTHTRSDESAIIARALASLGKRTDEHLLSALKDFDIQVRQRALIGLAQIWCLPLIGELADSDPEKRRAAARALGATSDERVTGPLVAVLIDKDQLVRWEATTALGEIWEFPALIELGDENEERRKSAVRTLFKLLDPRTIEPLIAALIDCDFTHRHRKVGRGLPQQGKHLVLFQFLHCAQHIA